MANRTVKRLYAETYWEYINHSFPLREENRRDLDRLRVELKLSERETTRIEEVILKYYANSRFRWPHPAQPLSSNPDLLAEINRIDILPLPLVIVLAGSISLILATAGFMAFKAMVAQPSDPLASKSSVGNEAPVPQPSPAITLSPDPTPTFASPTPLPSPVPEVASPSPVPVQRPSEMQSDRLRNLNISATAFDNIYASVYPEAVTRASEAEQRQLSQALLDQLETRITSNSLSQLGTYAEQGLTHANAWNEQIRLRYPLARPSRRSSLFQQVESVREVIFAETDHRFDTMFPNVASKGLLDSQDSRKIWLAEIWCAICQDVLNEQAEIARR